VQFLRDSGGAEGGGFTPLDTATGPSTFAVRREQVELLARALAVLLPIDRDLLVLTSEGQPLAEVARRTGLSYENAQRRRLRAVARLRRIYELLTCDAE
jgi:DNA-directed RNA polymerase specialized sigma24 family protein